MKEKTIILLLILSAISCRSKEDSLILGKWQVVEYSVSGVKHESERLIEFDGDGNYKSYDAKDTIHGEWRIKHNTLVLHQPEIKDMHGNRQVDAFTRVWEVELAENWMMMTGTARSSTADMILVLKRQ